MGVQQNFQWPNAQDIVFQVSVAPATNVSGWSLEFDLTYRQNSPQPIYSAFTLSGSISVVNVTQGIFQIPLNHSIVSGLISVTNVLNYTVRRVDSGNATDIAGGMVNLIPY